MSKLIILIGLFLPLQVVGQSNDVIKKTIQVTELEKFDPAAQIKSLDGYQMRARKIIVPVGVSISEHKHTARPGIVYVESGEIIEYRGKNSRLLKAGDSLIEDFSTVHSYKNESDSECVLIAFDIPIE
jgi:quercetin dioxygenase-like cupin family protein